MGTTGPRTRSGGGSLRPVLVAVAVLIAVVVAGCGSVPAPSQPPPAPASPGFSLEPGATLPPEIDHAMSQRRVFGLRSDLAWVLEVAADPGARTEALDFPMTLEEERAWYASQASFEEVARAVQAYGAQRPAEFGGVWIDQERRVVVAAWTANAELHRLAILAQLRKAAPLEARLVRYSEAQLNALLERIVGDRAWMESIGARFLGGGVMTMENLVDLEISSANADAPRRIAEHYGVGVDALRIQSDGTGIALKERGTVEGTVRRADGTPPGAQGWILEWRPDRQDGVGGAGECGHGDIGYGVAEDGTFELPCAPGGWTISVAMPDDAGLGWVPIGRAHVLVPEGGTVPVVIEVDPEHPLAP